jgi:DNA repair exonuclease SbcCD ATPase subunit
MIVFEKIRWKNFLSSGNQFIEVPLDQNSTTLIVGHNGAGKSTILDALCFALFKKPFREIKQEQLVNSINLGGTEVELEFSISNNKYKIRRGIKPNIFEIYQNGEMINQDATIADYQKMLEQQILKFNYRSFTQVVILGSSTFVPFMELKSSYRREVVEDILDIKIFSVMQMLAKVRIKEQEEQIKDILRELDITNAKIETQKEYIGKLQERSNIEVQSEIEKVTSNTNAIDKYNTHISALQSEISKLRSDIKDKDNLSDKSNKLRNFEAQFESKLKECNKHKSFYENHDNCPTCKQVLSNKQDMIRDNNQSIMKWNQALEDADKEIRNISKRLEKIQSIEADIRTVEIDVAKFEQSKLELHNINTKLTHKINELKQQSSDSGEARGKLLELEEQQKGIDEKKLSKSEELDYLTAAKTMLNDSGIKTKVIKQYLPIMNQLINKYLASMDFFVNFRLDNEFKETIRSRFRDEFSYASFSEGEKMRINLALLFTWRAIAKMKNSISTNLLLLDEIFDSSLDGTGTDDFLKILNTLEGENVFIISHKTDMIADRFANVMKFEKVGNFTKIIE